MASLKTRIIENIARERLLSVSNVFVMTVTFVLLGIFIIVVTLSQTALRYLEDQAQVTVFFKDDFSESNILTIKSTFESDSRVQSVSYISKEEAFKLFSVLNKDEPVLLESLSASILPASLEIRTKNIKDLSPVATESAGIEGVEEVRYFQDVIERFRVWSSIIYAVGSVLVVMFLVISYAIVMATLRATINSKGVELEIMKLVGASDTYVKAPLVYQGVVFGLGSSVIATVVLFLIYSVFWKLGMFSHGIALGLLPGVFLNPLLFFSILAFLLVGSGTTLGFLGSYTAVKKYLKY